MHPPRWVALLRKHIDSTAQLPIRISVLLVILLVYIALKLSLDVLLGAFAAGVVVRLFIEGEDRERISSKLEAIGFGFLIPIFFIESGINFDLHALDPQAQGAAARAGVRLALPPDPRAPDVGLLPRRRWPRARLAGLAVMSATGLPLIVVITTLGVDEHRMKPQNAAALVAAGMLSVLVYPIVGLRKMRRAAAGAENASRTEPTAEPGPGP